MAGRGTGLRSISASTPNRPARACPERLAKGLNPVAWRCLRELGPPALARFRALHRRSVGRAGARRREASGSPSLDAKSAAASTSSRTRSGLPAGLASTAAPSALSGGEAQRIRLAAQLGSNLQGVCCILDEPTIGLRATTAAARPPKLRKARGNTLVVVEHDEDTIRRADHVIDLGPGRRKCLQRRVVAGAPIADLMAARIGHRRCFRNPLMHPVCAPRRGGEHRADASVGACTTCKTSTCASRWPPHGGDRRVRLGQVDLARDVMLANLRQPCWRPRRNPPVPRFPWLGGAAMPSRAGTRSAACWRSRRRSARPRAPARPPTSALGRDPQALRRHLRARLRGWKANRFPSTPAPGAAPPAKARADHHRDELPARREDAVRDLRRCPLQCRDPGGAMADRTIADVLAMPVEEAVEISSPPTRRSPIRCACSRKWASAI